jgi:hypothetical protein
MIEVVTVGEVRSAEECRTVPYITGLMPFLDELDIDSDPSR